MDMAESGDLDLLWSVGGNFIDVLPDPAGVEAALAKIPFRVHQDIVLTRQMLVEPADVALILPAMTREIPGGVTSTSTERRIIFSPEIRGPKKPIAPEARWEGEVLLEVARRVRPELRDQLTYVDTAALRQEIARVVPLYQGIETLAKKGDQVQYGGPHLCAGWRFGTASGKAHFGVVPLPADDVPPGAFRVATRRGKQFNSMVHAEVDRLNGARRDHVLMSAADAQRLGLVDDARILLESPHGRYTGRVKIAPIAIGSLQVHWPEGNVLLDPRRRSRRSGIPDYNATATVTRVP
jgi:predicted molibdopterin-dependent oxidoreductase YjgC